MEKPKPIRVAVEKVGGQSRLARKIGVTPSLVNYWFRTGTIPIWRIPAVAKASGLPQSFFHGDAA